MNKQQYEWIRQSRHALLAQCETLTTEELSQPHHFALNNVKETLIHITKCYRNWIGSYLLGNAPVGDFPAEQISTMTFNDIEELYALVDRYVFEALDTFAEAMDTPVHSASSFKEDVQKTPQHLLFHAFTHECHHRGQIMAMLHLMGHKPANINLVLFESLS